MSAMLPAAKAASSRSPALFTSTHSYETVAFGNCFMYSGRTVLFMTSAPGWPPLNVHQTSLTGWPPFGLACAAGAAAVAPAAAGEAAPAAGALVAAAAGAVAAAAAGAVVA